MKPPAHGISHHNLSKMSYCIRFRSGTDVSPLDIPDDDQILLLAVIHGLLKGGQPFNTELLVHCNLRLHCRNQIVDAINDSLIILPDCFRRTLQSLPVLSKGFLLDMLRYKLHGRV